MTAVYRISWVPGRDRLLAVCHCGASNQFDAPVEAWAWLLDHPAGHAPADPPRPTEREAAAAR